MPVNFRKNTRLSYLICLALLLGIASITWITTKASAHSDDVRSVRENKTSLSQLLVSGNAANYLNAIKQWEIFSATTSQTLVRTDAEERGTSVKNANNNAEFIPGEVIVRFREGATAAKTSAPQMTVLRTSERDISAEVTEFEGSEIVSNLRLAHVAPEDTLLAVEAFNSREDVLYAEPNYVLRKLALPNDPRFGELWGLKNTGQVGFNDATGQQQAGTVGADIDAELAWNVTTGNRSVVVGVIDEGIDINHPDLRDNIWRNPGETAGNGVDDDGNGYIDDINGWDFANNDASVYDGAAGDNSTDSHGTHVAGTIGATGNNGSGIAGVNWQVSIMSLKFLGKDAGDTLKSITAMNYARMMRQRGINIRVLNNSYGGSGKSQAAIDAIRALNDAGILFVAAAGNTPLDSGSFPFFPSNYNVPNVIAVAATDRFDNIAAFSTFGARTVSIGAPGRSILSTTPNNTYSVFSGTSMASPHVAGVAALVLSVNPNISAQNLRGVLAYSGDVLPALQGKTTTGRRLNAYSALLSQAENDTTAPATVSDLRVTAQDGRAVNLAWTAVGDDGNSGQAADYDFVFTNSTTGVVTVTPASLSTLLPRPAGAQETANVQLPYRNFAGSVELRVYDNAGNVSRTSVNVTVSVNAGSDPYEIALTAATALSTGGTPLALNGDDLYRTGYALPFAFPFFGQNRNTVTISTNGSLYFPNTPVENDAGSSIEGLNGSAMIAGLWDDLRTDRPTGDVYVTSTADRIIFRWQAVTFATPLSNGTTRGENPVNFEIELRRDGTVQTRYGDGNTRLFPVVGISGGEPDAYVVESHTSELTTKNLTNAQTVTFTPRVASTTPAAVVSSIEPNTRGAGSAAFEIVVNGTGFLSNSVVRFNGQNRTTTFVSATQLRAQILASDVQTAGQFPVTVLNPNADVSNAINFTVVACTYTLSPTTATTPGNASTGSFNIASGTGCAYTAVSNNSFITVTSGASGTGNGAVAYSVGANTTGANRTGTITAGGQTFTLTQTTLPTLSITNVTLNEGDSGTTAFTFTVSLSAAFAQQVTVNYATANGTATAPSDYQVASGSLSFAPGETTKTVTVSVNGDTEAEANETFTVNLSNAVNATISTAVGTGTILNDDSCSYSITPASLNFTSASSTDSTFRITTQTGCAYSVTNNAASFITVTGGANGTGSGTVTFNVASNTGAARSGTITVGGQTFIVNQAAVVPGELDPSFGTGGVVTTAIGASSQANATVIQPDGKIVVSGTSSGPGFALARYNADGTLDTTFGTGGKVFTSTGQNYALALQSDGKIVAAGFTNNGSNNDFAVARYNTNGSLDPTFDNDGIVTVPLSTGKDEAYAVAVQSDGKIVLAGQSNNQIALVRLNTNGSLDTSFDSDGKVIFGGGFIFGMRLQTDGKIVVGGVSSGSTTDFLIARFNTNGSTDTSFGTGGIVVTDFGGFDYVTSLDLAPDGRIVAAGFSDVNATGYFAVARYNTDGKLDTSFDTDGRVVTIRNNSLDRAFAVAVQPNGSVLVGGYTSVGTSYDFALVRYNSNGSLDTNFGTNGRVITNLRNMEEGVRGLAIQSNGYAIATGYTQINAQTYNFATARYYLGEIGGCDYSVSPSGSFNFDASGGAASFNVTSASNGCTFSATSNNSFITITSGAGVSGNGTVTFSVAANTGLARTGTITVAGKTYTVSQENGCGTFTLSPTSATLPGIGGTGSFDITASSAGCSYNVTSSSFITVTSGASGTSNGTVSYSVGANTTGSNRTGTITAGGQTFTLTQTTLPTLSINNVTLNEGDSGTTAFTFTVSLSAALAQPVTVNYATTNGTAVAGEDYTAASGTLTFAAGEVNKTFTVSVNGDTVVEGNETFTVSLSNPNNATIAVGQATGTILNDDTASSIQFSLSNYTVNENQATASITVTRTGGTAAAGGSVNYSTANGTATAGTDYTAASGTLSFGAGETSKTFTVPIINDSVNETNETVNLILSGATGGATLGSPATAVLTIIDDDGAPTLSINNVLANEGNSGTTAFSFTVSLLGTTSQNVTVNFATSDGTATTPSDYQAASGSLSFAPGETSKTVTVSVNGDTQIEENEAFTVNLSNAVNATISTAVGTGTIQNDDSCSYAITPANLNVTSAGSTGNTFTITTQTGCAYSVVNNSSFVTVTAGANGTGGGTVTFNVAFNNGAARSGTITVGGQTLTVNQAAGQASARKTLFDYDGDGRSDVSVFRPSSGGWFIQNSSTGFYGVGFGAPTDKIVPADYDGDGKTDIAVYRSGSWYILRSSDNTFLGIAFGNATDIPAPGDFDGDGRSEVAVYRASEGNWYTFNLVNAAFSGISFGAPEDKPVVGDYDGDGRSDFAVYRPSAGGWYILQSQAGFTGVGFGNATDKPVPSDYDGDGRTDIAVYRDGNWYALRSSNGSFLGVAFGNATDIPAAADYDGDGKSEVAVYRASEGNWYMFNLVNAAFSGVQFGASEDKPTQSAFVR